MVTISKELILEKFCHKNIEAELRIKVAKMEGKLAATESTLKEKQALIKTLGQHPNIQGAGLWCPSHGS